MFNSFYNFLYPSLAALSLSFLATPFVIKLSQKMGIIDDPSKSSHPKIIHTYPVPRGGGLAIFFGVIVSALIFLPIDKHLLGIILGAIFVTGVGVLDDKYNLNPYLRLFLGFVAASLPIAAGIGISFISNPFNGILDLSHPQISFNFLGEQRSIWVLSDIFALFWIVFLMNILNMGAKGVDGQLPGVVVIASLIIAFLSLRFSADVTQWPIIVLAGITAGAFLGFLPWNFYPQKIMPGYSGSTLAGYMLAVMSILSTSKVGTLIVVLGIPLVDTGYTIVRRVLAGESPVWGDRGHLHHRLLDYGLSKRQVAALYWLFSGILGITALHLESGAKLYTMIGIVFFVGGLILFLSKKKNS